MEGVRVFSDIRPGDRRLVEMLARTAVFALPSEIDKCFSRVEDWSTNLRYEPASYRAREAELFLDTARVIIDWIDGRL